MYFQQKEEKWYKRKNPKTSKNYPNDQNLHRKLKGNYKHLKAGIELKQKFWRQQGRCLYDTNNISTSLLIWVEDMKIISHMMKSVKMFQFLFGTNEPTENWKIHPFLTFFNFLYMVEPELPYKTKDCNSVHGYVFIFLGRAFFKFIGHIIE